MSAPCRHGDCDARPSKQTGWCTFHDPDNAEVLAEGRSEGGKGRAQVPPGKTLGEHEPDIGLSTKADFLTAMATTINQVRRGQIGTETARTVGYLAGVALKALDDSGVDERVTQLEEKLRVLTRAASTDELLAAARAAHGDSPEGHGDSPEGH